MSRRLEIIMDFDFDFDNTVSKTMPALLDITLNIDALEWLFSKT